MKYWLGNATACQMLRKSWAQLELPTTGPVLVKVTIRCNFVGSIKNTLPVLQRIED